MVTEGSTPAPAKYSRRTVLAVRRQRKHEADAIRQAQRNNPSPSLTPLDAAAAVAEAVRIISRQEYAA